MNELDKWRVVISYDNHPRQTEVFIQDGKSWTLAEITEVPDKALEVAALMSAAPELLAALELHIKALTALINDCNFASSAIQAETFRLINIAPSAAREAINKATHRTSGADT